MTVYIVGLYCVVIFLGVPPYSLYLFISCLLLLQFMSTYTYSSLHVIEGFVIVAQGDGLMAIGCQRGMAAIVACVADGHRVPVWHGDDSRLCGHGY